MPLVLVVLTVVELIGGAGCVGALIDGIAGAATAGVHLTFWLTLVFVFLERAEAARETRTEIVGTSGRWTVDMLPHPSADRVGVGETVGEVLTTMLTIGGLLFLRDLSLVAGTDGQIVPFFDGALTTFWFPVLIAVLVSIALLQVGVFAVGRWTIPLAAAHAILQLTFAVPVVWLALGGTIINQAFAVEVGWPPLADGGGPVMLTLAIAVTLVTAWEIFDAFRRARRGPRAKPAAAIVQSLSR